ncbi:MAG: phosphoribosyl-ATP diphosphatase [Bacteroidales bacterium]|nr:phosphoribosyl-ATP diphosphatase [Bacteroidales bacterium]
MKKGNGKSNKDLEFLVQLQDLIEKRKKEMPKGSYTTKLFKKGVNKIAKKLGEETIELIIEAKGKDDRLFKEEAADLLYHYLVLLTQKGYRIEDIVEVLANRHVPNEKEEVIV